MNIAEYVEVSQYDNEKDYTKLEAGNGFILPTEGNFATGAIHTNCCAEFIALLEFSHDVPRGNHYHNKKIEHMIALDGAMRCDFYLIDAPQESLSLTLNPGQMVRIQPRCVHTYTAIDRSVRALEFAPQRFEESDTIVIQSS
jgi:hypothetical protein